MSLALYLPRVRSSELLDGALHMPLSHALQERRSLLWSTECPIRHDEGVAVLPLNIYLVRPRGDASNHPPWNHGMPRPNLRRNPLLVNTQCAYFGLEFDLGPKWKQP